MDIESIKKIFNSIFLYISNIDKILIKNKVLYSKNTKEKYSFQFYRCYKSFVYSIVKADKNLAIEEVAAIQDLFDNEVSLSEIKQDIEYQYQGNLLNDKESFIDFIKRFRELELNVNQYTGQKNNLVPTILDLFKYSGIYFSSVDNNIDEREVDLISSYLLAGKMAYESSFEKIKEKDIEINVVSEDKSELINNNNTFKSNSINITTENKTDKLLNELNNLIGLNQVKIDINNLINLVKIMKIRKERGLSVPEKSLHLVFTGNPGTGKTTVARLISEIYCSLGLLSKGHLIEIDRSGLVAGYVGQTALKVQEVVAKALGGILFIDEAYSLYSSKNSNDFGSEAINTLLKLMEDNRNDLVIIVAGYPDKMSDFIESNPGLKSRFNKYINFPNYSPTELFNIFEKMSKDHQMYFSEEVKCFAQKWFENIVETRTVNFGNGRDVRNIFENTLSNQANRLVENDNISDSDLSKLTIDDLKFGFETYISNIK